MASDHLVVVHREGVLSVTLDRPEVLNSINARMADELLRVLADAGRDAAVRAVLLTGSGRAFCAGQDLAEVMPVAGAAPPDLGEVVARQYTPLVRALRQLEKPVVCAVNGVAAGAGANLALACDLIVAAESATFIQSFTRIGLIPDSGGSFFLPRVVGLHRATALTMLGDRLDAGRARGWGLVHEVVPDGALGEVSFALARRLSSMPTRALGLAKRALNAALATDLDTQLALEEALQREAGATADHAEGVRAFVEKRTPRFEGR